MSKRQPRAAAPNQSLARPFPTAALIAVVLLTLLGGGATGWWLGMKQAAPVFSAPAAEEKAAIDRFVHTYFESWSKQDLKTYADCFHARAVIWFPDGTTLRLTDFIESQRMAHASSTTPLTEAPLSWDMTVKRDMASVCVHWQLERAEGPVRGYDFFTLVKVSGNWRIASLVFNEE